MKRFVAITLIAIFTFNAASCVTINGEKISPTTTAACLLVLGVLGALVEVLDPSPSGQPASEKPSAVQTPPAAINGEVPSGRRDKSRDYFAFGRHGWNLWGGAGR